VRDATYYVQISVPEEEFERWHTIAKVDDRLLAEEMTRLAEGSYGRVHVTEHYAARAMSRSALEKEHARQHADWELGAGRYRGYGDTLREKAERNLRSAPA
jgi:hypothetical protein